MLWSYSESLDSFLYLKREFSLGSIYTELLDIFYQKQSVDNKVFDCIYIGDIILELLFLQNFSGRSVGSQVETAAL